MIADPNKPNNKKKGEPCDMDSDGDGQRDEKGRLLPGHKGLERAGTTNIQKAVAKFRSEVVATVTKEDAKKLAKKLVRKALGEDKDSMVACKLLLDYFGKPAPDNTNAGGGITVDADSFADAVKLFKQRQGLESPVVR